MKMVITHWISGGGNYLFFIRIYSLEFAMHSSCSSALIFMTFYFEGLVKGKVESGLYNSVSEVMREALRLFYWKIATNCVNSGLMLRLLKWPEAAESDLAEMCISRRTAHTTRTGFLIVFMKDVWHRPTSRK